MEMILLIGIIVAFMLVGFFAGIEVAFVSANKLPIELKKKQGLRSGRILSEFMDTPAKFIGTTLIGMNLALVTYGLLIGEFLTPVWTWAEGFLVEDAVPYLQYIRIIFDTVLASTIIILFIFFSRAIFKVKNDTLLLFFTPVVDFFYGLLYPIASLFVSISEWILKYLFNVRLHDEKDAFNRVDLEQFIQQSREQAEENPELNTELFEAALSLPSIKIRQCLVPRKEVEALDINSSMEELKKKFMETKLSKLVIYEKNIDNILGYVHQLALFKHPSRYPFHPVAHPCGTGKHECHGPDQ